MSFQVPARRVLALLGLAAACQIVHAESGWLIDDQGCKHVNPVPAPNETASWSGACVDGLAEGEGSRQWFIDGRLISTYTGTLKAGEFSGHGHYARTNGLTFEGEFVAGKYDGPGVLTSPDGSRYEGGFAKGKFSGHGVLRKANGDVYDGSWSDGFPVSAGQMMLANGDRFEGNFSAGAADALGSYQWAQGDRYDGEFVAGKPWGKGTYQLANGSRYEGFFVDGLPSGTGTATTASGDSYEGEFVRGVPSGAGLFASGPGESPAGADLQQRLSFQYAPVSAGIAFASLSRRVCTKMGRPELPRVNWVGKAIYQVVAEVKDGRVTSTKIYKVQGPEKGLVQNNFLISIQDALRDTYECPGNHVFVQTFQFNLVP